MNDFYVNKASLPRECRRAPDLRTALQNYATKRLLHVSDVCLEHSSDIFRKEFGLLHLRYANMLFVITEVVQDVSYLVKSLITWLNEDFNNALSGAQKDAAGLCCAELTLLVTLYQ